MKLRSSKTVVYMQDSSLVVLFSFLNLVYYSFRILRYCKCFCGNMMQNMSHAFLSWTFKTCTRTLRECVDLIVLIIGTITVIPNKTQEFIIITCFKSPKHIYALPNDFTKTSAEWVNVSKLEIGLITCNIWNITKITSLNSTFVTNFPSSTIHIKTITVRSQIACSKQCSLRIE